MLRIRISWIRNILASWIRIRKNMRIQGIKYQPKEKKFTLKTQIWTIEKLDTKFENFALLKKNQ